MNISFDWEMLKLWKQFSSKHFIHIFCIYVLLCASVNSLAEPRIKRSIVSVDTKNRQESDSIVRLQINSLEKFNARVSEYADLLIDYSKFIIGEDLGNAQYLDLICGLFDLSSDSSRIEAISDNDSLELFQPYDFFRMVMNGEIEIISFESVYMPSWIENMTMAKRGDEFHTISCLYDFDTRKILNTNNNYQSLKSVCEQTEQGLEFIPKLGTLRILIKYRTEYGNDNHYDGSFISQLPISDYEASIKLVDEFFERFNGEELRADVDKDNRFTHLLLLFDISQFSSPTDERFIKAQSLINTIISKNISIIFEDTTWFAKAVCHAKLNGKAVNFTLYLRVENRHEDLYKWSITRAEGDIFKPSNLTLNNKIFLSPNDHNVDFLSLKRATGEMHKDVINYASQHIKWDETSVFFVLVEMGLLKIEYVQPLYFEFYQVPGYMFSITEFDRNNGNSGWLINDFNTITIKEKNERIKYLSNY